MPGGRGGRGGREGGRERDRERGREGGREREKERKIRREGGKKRKGRGNRDKQPRVSICKLSLKIIKKGSETARLPTHTRQTLITQLHVYTCIYV